MEASASTSQPWLRLNKSEVLKSDYISAMMEAD
jgi:hypothetical protein